MRLRWVKADGCGNICLYAWAREVDGHAEWNRVGAAMCSSYDADVLMLIDNANGKACLRVINADGSDGGLCVNGLRCYAVVIEAEDWTEVRCGDRDVLVRAEGTHTGVVRSRASGMTEELGDGRWFVDLGNPHVIVPVDDVAGCELAKLAAGINSEVVERSGHWRTSPRWHTELKAGVNVHAIGTVVDGALEARPHERGCGETGACGSGAIAIAMALREQGLIEEGIGVCMPGGRLDVRFVGGDVEIGGSAVVASEGWFEM